jgi:hypothetical protein
MTAISPGTINVKISLTELYEMPDTTRQQIIFRSRPAKEREKSPVPPYPMFAIKRWNCLPRPTIHFRKHPTGNLLIQYPVSRDISGKTTFSKKLLK